MGIIDTTVKDIIALKIQGASEVRKKAVEALVKSSQETKARKPDQFRKEFLDNTKMLANSRPTEPELRMAIRIIKKSISEKDISIEEMKIRILRAAKDYEQGRKDSLKLISQYGAEMIKSGSTVMTICHSRSVIDLLIKAKHKIKEVYCLESRPLYQGRMTAKDLSEAGLKVTLIVDNAASTVMKKCDYLFSGADAIMADGDVVNKIGTNQISMLCKAYGVKHYVAASTHKFEPASFFGKDEPIEHRNPEEVISDKERGSANVLNPAFDRTDASTIEGIITELGIFPPQVLAERLFEELGVNKHKQEFLRL
ncbi:MAG: S-methyl-5-thioribose-1-phosphate isomerase [archaeon]